MALWVLKPGENGEREDVIFKKSVAAIGWEDLPDLSKISERDSLKELYTEKYPNASLHRMRNHVGQIYAFLLKAKIGDLIVLTHKSSPLVSIGKIISNYEFRTDLGELCNHTRKIEWLKTEISRNSFKQDLLYSFGAFMTFCQVKRNNAEERIKEIIKSQLDIGLTNEEEIEVSVEKINLAEFAEDQIIEKISQVFKGHKLTTLIAAILRAKGYTTKTSPPGPDGGIDILASSGILGFEEPKICVQVKSQSTPIEINPYRELKGLLSDYGATNGLFVSWGSFKSSTMKESKSDYFNIRLWDSKDIIRELLRHYHEIDSEIKVDLPLRQIWILSEDE